VKVKYILCYYGSRGGHSFLTPIHLRPTSKYKYSSRVIRKVPWITNIVRKSLGKSINLPVVPGVSKRVHRFTFQSTIATSHSLLLQGTSSTQYMYDRFVHSMWFPSFVQSCCLLVSYIYCRHPITYIMSCFFNLSLHYRQQIPPHHHHYCQLQLKGNFKFGKACWNYFILVQYIHYPIKQYSNPKYKQKSI
jgi:hypothetical protein